MHPLLGEIQSAQAYRAHRRHSSWLYIRWHHFGSLKSAMVGVPTPWKWATIFVAVVCLFWQAGGSYLLSYPWAQATVQFQTFVEIPAQSWNLRVWGRLLPMGRLVHRLPVVHKLCGPARQNRPADVSRHWGMDKLWSVDKESWMRLIIIATIYWMLS